MPRNVAQKLIESHLVDGEMTPGEEIGLRIDQTLTQDATGTLVMLEFQAMGLPRVKTELSAQYVDHNLLQEDFRNPDDHVFLHSAAKKYGVHFSPAGNGVSHPVHMERFGIPGKTLLGSDSHTCAAGSMGMLAIGAGGLEVAMAMAGEPFYVRMPKIRGIRLTGELPDWVSAKDVILEILRRYDVDGGKGWIMEFHGPGVETLTAMDRHVIANMGMETGATATVFPSDDQTRWFLEQQRRGDDWRELKADEDARYDEVVEIDLAELEPLIAKPSSPGNVVPVREVAGEPVFQSYIGSSANPGLRDFGIAGRMVAGRRVAEGVSFDVNPTSRQILENMTRLGTMVELIRAGARLHQTGCNGCIGMGQAPATGRNSLRTVPRNFPGRSGTEEDAVFLCSPETATAAALTGVITDPRDLDMDYPRFQEPKDIDIVDLIIRPAGSSEDVALQKGPNIVDLPEFEPLPETFEGPVLLKTGDDVSTDEILPGGAQVMPLRSNIPEISKFAFSRLDDTFHDRAIQYQDSGSFVVGGDNYGQGSSREHAAIAPAYLGVKAVLAKSFARIHWQNLVNFGVVPLEFERAADYDAIEQGDELFLGDLHDAVARGRLTVENRTRGETYELTHSLSRRQVEILHEGSLINWIRSRKAT